MTGIVLAVASAFCWAILDALRKVMGQELHPIASASLITLGSCVLFFAGLLWVPVEAWPGSRFWWAMAASTCLNLITHLLFFRAVQLSPLSLTIPYLSFTPVFLLLSGALFLGEWPGWMGLMGIFTVLLGAILLNPTEDGHFAPFRALKHERGSLYMVLVAFLWSLSGPIEKIAVSQGNLFLFGGCVNGLIGASLLLYLLAFQRKALQSWQKAWKVGLCAASVQMVALMTQFFALPLIFVAYLDTIKRSGALFAVLIGYFFFQERPLRPRLAGAVVMVAGVSMIVLGR